MTRELERRLIDRDEVWNLFCDHYWDSFQKDRDLILCHVDAVLRSARAALKDTDEGLPTADDVRGILKDTTP